MKPKVPGYDLLNQIGFGSFGVVYVAKSRSTNHHVAIKVECSKRRVSQLKNEFMMYKYLEGGRGIPRAHIFLELPLCNAMVLNLLGPSLEALFNDCRRNFSLKTVLLLADQMLTRLEYIHSKNIIHRDLKPSNFAMGGGRRSNELYLIDFGFAKEIYHLPSSSSSLPKNRKVVGTLRFMSIYTHMAVEPSFRDDLESFGYILLYFLRGTLPWQKIQTEDRKQLAKKIWEMKMSTPIVELCDGLPAVFDKYFSYCRTMEFNEVPHYSRLKRMFQQLFHQRHFQYDYVYDWDGVEPVDTDDQDTSSENSHA